MSKSKIFALAVILTLLAASNAAAKTESYLMALGIVESFDIEMRDLIKEDKWNGKKRGFYKRSTKEKKEATNSIKSVRWSEGPSPKRFSRLFKIVDRYTGSIVDAANDLAGSMPEKDRSEVESAARKLAGLRMEFLDELQKTSASERKPSTHQKPSSVIDRSPYEQRPGDIRGIYER